MYYKKISTFRRDILVQDLILDLQQDLLNPIGMDILKFEEEINRFYQF